MKRLSLHLTALLACAALAAPASAQTGNGLYEPFPGPASKLRAKRFIEGLPGDGTQARRPLTLSDEELERGVFVSAGAVRDSAAGSTAGPAGGPSSRATGSAVGPSFGWPLGILLVLAAVGAPRALAGLRS